MKLGKQDGGWSLEEIKGAIGDVNHIIHCMTFKNKNIHLNTYI